MSIKSAIVGSLISVATGMIVSKATDMIQKIPPLCTECKKLGSHKETCSKFRTRVKV